MGSKCRCTYATHPELAVDDSCHDLIRIRFILGKVDQCFDFVVGLERDGKWFVY